MQRAKEVESAELNKKFNSVMLAPKAALWMKMVPQTILPENAVKSRNINSVGQKQPVVQSQDQGFQQAGMNAWSLPEDKVPV